MLLFATEPTSSTDYGCQSGSSCGQWCDGGVSGSKLEKRIPPWFKEKVWGKGEQKLRGWVNGGKCNCHTCESKQNLSKGSFFLFGFRASEVIRILSSRILARVSETCLNGNQSGSSMATMLVLPGNSGNVWRFCDEDEVDGLAMGGGQKAAQVPAVPGFWSETKIIGISLLDTSSSTAVRNVRILDCSSKSAKPQGSKASFQQLPTSRAE